MEPDGRGGCQPDAAKDGRPADRSWLTTSEAAKMLGVCPATAVKMLNRGILKGYAFQLGRYKVRRIDRASVERIISGE